MVIEVLYEEFYIYGDREIPKLLDIMYGKDQVIKTRFHDRPYFADKKPDMLYIGPMSEKNLELVKDKLDSYKDILIDRIEDNMLFIISNSALDLFGKTIEIRGMEDSFEPLGILDYHIIRDYNNRHHGVVISDIEGIENIGYQMGFSQYFYGEGLNSLYQVKNGYGFNKQTKRGGFRYKNVYGIELLGPFFLINPLYFKKFIMEHNIDTEIPYYQQAIKLHDEKIKFYLSHK